MLYRIELIHKDGTLALEKTFTGLAPSDEKKDFESLFEGLENRENENEHFEFLLFFLDPVRLCGNYRSKRCVEHSKSQLSSFITNENDFDKLFGSFYDHYMLRKVIPLAS